MKPEEMDGFQIASFLLIPSLIVLVTFFWILNVPGAYEPPHIFLILNTLFTGLIPIIVAAIAFAAYRRNPSAGLLLIGTGMLVFGIGSVAAPLAAGLPGGRNMNITIHNTMAFGCAVCQLLGGAFLLAGRGSQLWRGRNREIGVVYGTAAILLLLLIAATVEGVTPVFFDPVAGYLVIRQIIIAGAIAFFGAASAVFYLGYLRRNEKFLFWYAIGLGLISTGLIAAVLSRVAGDPFSWTARISQYLGCLSLLAAFFTLRTEARQEHIPVDEMLARFFGKSGEGYQLFVMDAPDPIVVIRDNRVVFANNAAFRMYGAGTPEEMKRIPVLDLVAPEEREKIALQIRQVLDGEPYPGGEVRLARKDGAILDLSVRAARIEYEGMPAVLAILRDITAEKQAERELAKASAKLSRVLDSIQDDFMVIGRDWKFVFAGRKFAARVGKVPEDLAGRNIWEMFPKYRGTVYEEYVREAMEKREIRRFELAGKYADGWYSMAVFPSEEGITVLGTDITERRQAGEALKESEQRFRSILDHSVDALYRRDLKTDRFEYFSPVFEQISGFSRQEIAAMGTGAILGRVHPDDRPRVMAGKIESRGVSEGMIEYRFRRRDGTWIWISDKFRVISEAQGVPVGREGIVRDITDQKNAEAALRESEEKFRALIETTNDFIWEMDPQGRYTYCSPQMETLWGIRPETMIGKTPFDVMPDADKEKGRELFAGFAASKKPFSGLVTAAIAPPGRLIHVDTSGVPFFDAGGNLLGYRGITRDITERVQADATLRESERKFSVIFEQSPTAISLSRASDGKLIEVNRSFTELFGISRDEAIGRDPAELGISRDPGIRAGLLAELEEKGSVRDQVITTYHARDGSAPVLLANLEKIDIGGEGYIIMLAIDITEQKKAQDELRQKQAEIRALFENIPAGLVLFDATTPEYRVLVHNRYYQELFPEPYRTDGMAGLSVRDYAPDLKESGVIAVFDEVTGSRRAKHVLDFPYRSGTKNDRWFNWYLSPIVIGEKTVSLVSMSLDVTAWHRAEEELQNKSDELAAANENLQRIHLQLVRTVDDVERQRDALKKSEAEIRDALAEKEVLLSEIHHRVKNNLTAFIALLSLEGAYDQTAAGIAMKNDLQNRARSMALIHDTLYRTHHFSTVDMDVYLTTLVNQIVCSSKSHKFFHPVVEAGGVSLDVGRATTAGLIVNELVTNVLKYAYPESRFPPDREEPFTVRVAMSLQDGEYTLRISDEGVGLPAGFDIGTSKTLGLKLVRFLAGHQLRATVEAKSEWGTEFVVRFRQEIGEEPDRDPPVLASSP